MNRAFKLAVLLLPLIYGCGQKSPEVAVTPLPSSSAEPSATVMPSSSAAPIFSSPFVSASPAVPSRINDPVDAPFPNSSPDYKIPSPIPIAKPKPPRIPDITANSGLPTTKTDGKKAAEILQEAIITPDGIGRAKVGMTLGELKQVLGDTAQFVVQENFAPNYDAIAVTQQGKVQYYIPYPQDNNFGDQDRIRFLITDNPSYKTGQGVSPGMPIKKASALYGTATLSLSREVNAQEIVKFANQPKELVFRSQQPPGQDQAGIYPESNDDQLETNKYADQATIRSIIVSCKEEICGAEH